MDSKNGYATTIQIRILASLLVKLAKRDLEIRLQKSGTKITSVQYNVLRLLKTGNYTLTELAQKMFIEPASLMPVIDGLEKRKLLSRTQDNKDRRRTPLVLNKKLSKKLLSIPLVDDNDSLVLALRTIGIKKSHQALGLLQEMVNTMTQDKNLIQDISNIKQ